MVRRTPGRDDPAGGEEAADATTMDGIVPGPVMTRVLLLDGPHTLLQARLPHGPRHPRAVKVAPRGAGTLGGAREFYGVKHALGLGSGTGALNVAMSALGIGPGCEVIVPAFMWVSTIASSPRYNDRKPPARQSSSIDSLAPTAATRSP